MTESCTLDVNVSSQGEVIASHYTYSTTFWRLMLAMIQLLSRSVPVAPIHNLISQSATRVATITCYFTYSKTPVKPRFGKSISSRKNPLHTTSFLIDHLIFPQRPFAMTTTRASSKRTAAQESSTQTPVASQPQAKTPQQKKSQASAKKAQTKPTSKPEPEPQLQSEAIPQASPPTTRSRKRKADIGSRTDKTTRPARGRAVRFVEDKPKSEETSGKVPAPSKCDDTESVEQSNLSNKPDETVAEKTDDQEDETVKQRQYFLIKSEPESRMQDGHDMKFSIDDLIAEDQSTAHWDGVRNYEARNVIKEMRLGDRAFFYHSNSRKDRPSIVGEVEIVKEAYPGTFFF